MDILECTKEGDIEEKVFNFVRKLTCHCNLELKYDTAKLQPLHGIVSTLHVL